MNVFSSLSNFLYDKDYFVALFDNQVYVYNYKELLFLGDSKIIVLVTDFNLHVTGNSLCIKRLDKNEILIEGEIIGVTKKYE